MKNLLFMALFALALYSCSKDENPSNTAPVIKAQAFTVAENINDTFVIGTVAATDADKDKLAFSIATNSGNLFEITSAGALSLASGKTLDFATKSQHVLSVNVSDGTATATDAEQDPLTFTITADASGLFEISDAGELSLSAGSSLDFATAAEHTLTVTVSDGNSTAQATITINVLEVNGAPTLGAQTFEAAEDIADTDVIGTVMAPTPTRSSSRSYRTHLGCSR